MRISTDQRRFFVEHGYLQLPQVLPTALVKQLRAEVLQDVPLKGGAKRPANGGANCGRDGVYEPEQHEFSPVLAEAHQAAERIAVQLLGESPATHFGQLILAPKQTSTEGRVPWHIDGMGRLTQTDTTWADLPFFQLAVGCFLTDLSGTEAKGQLYLEDRGHELMVEFFREHPQLFSMDNAASKSAETRTLVRDWLLQHLRAPVRIEAKAGDLVLFHDRMPHGLGPNQVEQRPAVYFRFGSYQQTGQVAFLDLWHDWSQLNA